MLKKKEFYNDFKFYEEKTEENKVYKRVNKYTGNLYVVNISKHENQKRKFVYIFAIIALITLYSISGFQNTASNSNIFVILPYAVEFLPIIYVIFGLVSLIRCKQILNSKDHYYSYERLEKVLPPLILISTYIACAQLVFLIVTKLEVSYVCDLVFLCCEILICIIGFLLKRELKSGMPYKMQEEKNKIE